MSRQTLLMMIAAIALASTTIALAADLTTPASLSSSDSQVKETELGSLVADALRAVEAKADIAFLTAASLKDVTIPAGKVKTEDVAACLQFPDDKIAVLELTGEQIHQALERSVGTLPQKNQGFLQVSGIEFTVNLKASKGSRVSDIKIGKDDLEDDEKYRVVTTAPLAKGANGYFTIWDKRAVVDSKSKDTTVGEALEQFMEKQKTLDYKEKRITVKGK